MIGDCAAILEQRRFPSAYIIVNMLTVVNNGNAFYSILDRRPKAKAVDGCRIAF